jgi:hypothetical protein
MRPLTTLYADAEIDDVLEWITMLYLGLLAIRQALGITDIIQEPQLRTLFTPAMASSSC